MTTNTCHVQIMSMHLHPSGAEVKMAFERSMSPELLPGPNAIYTAQAQTIFFQVQIVGADVNPDKYEMFSSVHPRVVTAIAKVLFAPQVLRVARITTLAELVGRSLEVALIQPAFVSFEELLRAAVEQEAIFENQNGQESTTL